MSDDTEHILIFIQENIVLQSYVISGDGECMVIDNYMEKPIIYFSKENGSVTNSLRDAFILLPDGD